MSTTTRPIAVCAFALAFLAAGCGDDEGDGAAPAAPAAPVIVTQPAEVAAAEGAWVTFTVEATGEGLEYGWQHSYDGGTTWFPLAWGAWDSYTLDGVSFGIDGVLFRCVVSNTGGEAVSDAAELHVLRVIFVDASATGACNGMTWGNAFTDLQDALAAASPGWDIWVAAGTYTPTDTIDMTATFQLPPDTEIYGGFSGQEMAFDERDYAANVTILSGNIGDPADYWDNSYHVVTGADGAMLDGFTIMDGFAIGGHADSRGGGMRNHEVSPVIANCTFSGNSASSVGGGMDNLDASPTVTNCTFSGNSAAIGGGIFNDGASSPTIADCTFDGNTASIEGGGLNNGAGSSPTITNCTFRWNSAPSGGGMVNAVANATVLDCTFSSNTALYYGGGMYNLHSSNLTVIRCTFDSNAVTGGPGTGGGMHSDSSTPIVTYCTFSGNSATIDGGGMHNWASSATVTDCLFVGNTAGYGAGLYNRQGSDSAVTNCLFVANSALSGGGGGMMNYESSDAAITNCTFSGNDVATSGGAMFNGNDSNPTVTNCILWGDSATISGDEIYNSASAPTVGYSCVEGGLTTGCVDGGGNIGTDLVNDDPDFVGAAGGDLRLQASSPCIDAGDDSAIPAGGWWDLDENWRVSGSFVDMGAYEYQSP